MKSRIMLVLCLMLLVSGGIAASNGKNEKRLDAQSVITAEALKGQSGTDLLIHVPPDITTAGKIQVKAYYANGTQKFTRNFFDMAASKGIILIQFDDLMQGERVDIRLQIEKDHEDTEIEQKGKDKKEDKEDDDKNSDTLTTSTVVRLKPDLRVYSVKTAENVMVGDRLSVEVAIQEANGDTGAEAAVSLIEGGSVLDTRNVVLSGGGMTSAVLSTIFSSSGQHELSVRITNVVPPDYNETNNVYAPITVTVESPDATVSGANAPHSQNLKRPPRKKPDLSVSGVTAPARLALGERFEALATIVELSGNTGANATVALLENGTVLDSKTLGILAGGSGTVSLSTVFISSGQHDLSVRITNVVPPDSNETNNVYSPLTVSVVSPDLAVSSVNSPSQVAVGERFEALATIVELSGNTGANATVALLENGTLLDSKTLDIPASGSSIVSLNGSLGAEGNHNITVRIINSVPPDNFPGNNERSFVVTAKKSPEFGTFYSDYYYKIVSLNFSHYITDSGHVDNYEKLEVSEDEAVTFTFSSARSLGFPIRLYLNLTNESGGGNGYYETFSAPTLVEGSRKTFTKYYPESNAMLTLRVDGNGTFLSIEGKANSTVEHSKGYLYWWFKPPNEWDVTTSKSNGSFIRAMNSLNVRVELEDGARLLGGSAVISIMNNSYTGGWIDTSEGRFEERRYVGIYTGTGSGNTVI